MLLRDSRSYLLF